ncbi:CHAP domain-containing protein [Nonomuraea sp. NN258]|uniref:CHAP domain-containing protein n=1 Tax=Nonomuraea antri TaxID=2730852 RepID=UPI0015695B11|nr:CHAP domain-containing protein [Nonomuraea antri]NRQ39066.1 CHAP domain-containing protein [Nonomuraea antri]
MATARLTSRMPKFLSHAVLGAGVIASALGANAVTAHADQAAKPEEAKVKVSAAQVLDTARSQVGVKENAQGGGTKFQQWYASSTRGGETAARDGGARADYLNAAWCSMFVSWVGEHTGARAQIGWDAYTVSHAKWFKDNGRFGSQAKPGSVVFFSWKGGKDLSDIQHVGFVVKDNGDGTISTIEGNTGNGKVEERKRPTSQVVGYGYPNYAA